MDTQEELVMRHAIAVPAAVFCSRNALREANPMARWGSAAEKSLEDNDSELIFSHGSSAQRVKWFGAWSSRRRA